jgi:CubicO group peptidase (beta-lactamase class C family)
VSGLIPRSDSLTAISVGRYPETMRKFFKIGSVILLAAALAVGQNQQTTEEIDTFLGKLTREQGFSGSVLVARNGRILLEKGYGSADLKKSVPAGAKTKYYIASISKQLTAAAILKLEEQGKLSVNDPVGKYLKNIPAERSDLKIHHLLSQSSGIDQNYAADGITDREKAVSAIFAKPLKHAPGEKFTYSNDNYSLLAIIVEAVSGKSYEDYLRKNLFAPLKMSDTGFWGEKAHIAELLKQPDRQMLKPNWGFRGGTGIYSTVGDLFKWQQALFGDNILNKTSRQKILTPYYEMSRGKYGYGWFMSRLSDGRESIWAPGAEDFGHSGIIKSYPDGFVLVILSNAGQLNGKFARAVALEGIEEIILRQ